MTSTPGSRDRKRRFDLRTPLMAALGLLAMASCATTDTRPTTPVYTGNERPDPIRPPRPEPPTPKESDESQVSGTDLSPLPGPIEGMVPRHLAQAVSGAELDPQSLKHIAVLLPFSSTNATVRKEAQSLLDGVETALFEAGVTNVVLLPKDTAGVPATAAVVAEEAVNEGADAFIGPLFGHNVRAVSTVAARIGAPVLSFSTESAVAGQGAYLVSLPLEEEIARIVDWAALKGVTQFAMFGPNNAYGHRVERALRFEAQRRNASVIRVELYSPSDPSPTAQAEALAYSLNEADKYTPGQVAVLIPEQGVRLRAVAPLLPYYDVDINRIRFLGTGLWNTPEVWREPTLRGGAFAAPDPDAIEDYRQHYQSIFGSAPTDFSTLGYDAAMMTLLMMQEDAFSRASLERPDGFMGMNGLFRFRSDGTIERGLAVLQVTGRGNLRVADAAPTRFSPDGS